MQPKDKADKQLTEETVGKDASQIIGEAKGRRTKRIILTSAWLTESTMRLVAGYLLLTMSDEMPVYVLIASLYLTISGIGAFAYHFYKAHS